MLKRIYINNFRGFVNFELSVDAINLFLGPNGAGKSTIFDVVQKIQAFVGGNGKASDIFKAIDLTRWQKSLIQSFELEINSNRGIYKYELAIEHTKTKQRARVLHERLWFENKPLLDVIQSKGHGFVYDNNDVRTAIPYVEDHSILSILPTYNEHIS